jgi:hypothetical protein
LNCKQQRTWLGVRQGLQPPVSVSAHQPDVVAKTDGSDILSSLTSKQLCFMDAIRGMPWTIVPFVLGMFILVESLTASGWIEALAIVAADGMGASETGAILASGCEMCCCFL